MIFKPVLIEEIAAGRKTVTRRPVDDKPCPWVAGKTYALLPGMARNSVGRILIKSVEQQYLQQIDNEDAVKEGFADAAAFAEYWSALYKGKFDKQMKVWRVEFELVELTHEICKCCNGLGAREIEA